jgi:hypothetical protein
VKVNLTEITKLLFLVFILKMKAKLVIIFAKAESFLAANLNTEHPHFFIYAAKRKFKLVSIANLT